MRQRDIAGRDNVIPGLSRHMPARQHIGDTLFRHWCIRYQNDGTAVAPEPHQRRARALEGLKAIVHNTPDVAEQDVIAAENLTC